MTFISLVAAAYAGGILGGQVQDPRFDLQLTYPDLAISADPSRVTAMIPPMVTSARNIGAYDDKTIENALYRMNDIQENIKPPVVSEPAQAQSYTFDPFDNNLWVPQGSRTISKEDAKKVSVSLKNASVREVLDWLQKQGVSFIIEDGKLDDKRKVTLNAANVPVGDVVDSLAAALGGSWTRRGEMRVFNTHAGMAYSRALPTIAVDPLVTERSTKALTDSLKRMRENSSAFSVSPKAFRSLTLNGSSDFKKLIQSLTPAQREKNKAQGYLKVSDLTPAQRKMIGDPDLGGKFEIKINMDGQELTIKNG